MTTLSSPQKNSPGLVIWLRRAVCQDTIGEWSVERIGVNAGGYTHNIALTAHPAACTTLSHDVWTYLQDYLPENTENFVLTARDSSLETKNLVLNSLTVTGQRVIDGVQRVLYTVRNVIGTLRGLFLPHAYPDMLAETECNLSTRTLNDIVMPALNLAAVGPIASYDSAKDQVAAFVDRLRENKEELEFYASLISRFISARERRDGETPDMQPRHRSEPVRPHYAARPTHVPVDAETIQRRRLN